MILEALAPGWPVLVEELSPNHWVGACRTVVIAVLFEGSHDDPSHVRAGVRLARRLVLRHAEPLRLLAILPPGHRRPPSAAVRTAVASAVSALGGRFDRFALVLPGAGFLDAIHRGAATGILGVSRLTVPHCVTSSLEEASAFVTAGDPVHPALARFCTTQMPSTTSP